MSLADLVGEVLGADEVEDGRAWVRAGDHDRTEQLLAGVERHPGRPSAAHVYRANGGIKTDLGAMGLRTARERRAYAPMPPRTWPHAPATPFSSPSSWCSRL